MTSKIKSGFGEIRKNVRVRKVKDIKPGDIIFHFSSAWMALDQKKHSYANMVDAVCLYPGHKEDKIGNVTYFGDGDPDCEFVVLDADFTFHKVYE